ncbi:MAG: hypothetical protein KatS3mg087_1113 [Patescibacteria group bacterium]|nr:MAG: hypothetical protein KatS3mg087_1113 [Patescibacteria group bacterium]
MIRLWLRKYNNYFKLFVATDNFKRHFGFVPDIESVIKRAYELNVGDPHRFPLDATTTFARAAVDVGMPIAQSRGIPMDQLATLLDMYWASLVRHHRA